MSFLFLEKFQFNKNSTLMDFVFLLIASSSGIQGMLITSTI